MSCPDVTCKSTVYITNDKVTMINKGHDQGYCKVCKQRFGKVKFFKVFYGNVHVHETLPQNHEIS